MNEATQVTTFYSFKGGVGRSILMANVGVLLARGGERRAPRKTLLVDLDAEAPGLHRVPGITPKRPPKRGLFEWLHELQQQNLDLPDAKHLTTLARSFAPTSCLPEHLFVLPAHGAEADFAEVYEQVDWERLFTGQRALALFRAVLAHASAEGFEHILLDSRTGLTDLGGLLTVALPHTAVLVSNYGSQSIAGLTRLWRGMESAAAGKSKLRDFEPLERLLVASPVPERPDQLAARRQLLREQFAQLPTERLLEIPLEPDLLVAEALYALEHDAAHPLVAAYTRVAAQIDHLRAARLDRLEQARRAAQQRPAANLPQDPDEDPLRDPRERSRKHQGDRFEERVALVLRLLGYEVEREQIIGGSRVDLVATKGDLLSSQTFFVECKDHGADQPKETLEKLWSWVSGEEARRRRARGLCVARSFSPAALAFAKDHPADLQAATIDDLERSLLDFTRYLRDLCLAYENTELFRTYVDQRLTAGSESRLGQPGGATQTLVQHGLDWANGRGGRFWLLLGDYGTGKSAFVRTLAWRLATAALTDADAPIPLYVNLKDYPSTLSFTALVVEHLRSRLNGPVDPEVIRHLLRAGRVVLLLDSFDEMGIASEGRALERQLREFAGLTADAPLSPRGCRVVLTCRTHFFRSQQQTKAVAGGVDASGLATELAPLGELAKQFDATIDELDLFDAGQIERYLMKSLGSEAKAAEALQFIRQTHDLTNLAPRPVLLEMIWKELPALTRSQNHGERITAAALYYRFANTWLKDKSGGQLKSSAEQRWRILERLAVELWQAPQNRMHYDRLAELVHALPPELRADVDPRQLDLELRTAAFLTRTQDGFYGFSHKSFREFFFAFHLLRLALERNHAAFAATLKTEPLSPELAGFLAELTELQPAETPRTNQAESVSVESALRSVLASQYVAKASENALRLAYHTSASRLRAGLVKDLADAMQPCVPPKANLQHANLAGMDLVGAWLENARLDGASLVATQLGKAWLAGAVLDDACAIRANFAGAQLQRASLRRADLRGALLVDAQATGARFTEARLSGANAHRANLVEADLRQADLAGFRGTACDRTKATFDGAIEHRTRWARSRPEQREARLRTASLLASLHLGHRAEVTWVAISPDGNTLATASNDNSAKLWDLRSRSLLASLEGHSGWVLHLAFSPDGNTLATASKDHSAKLWDLRSRSLLASLEGHSGWVLHLAFSPDGNTLATASGDCSAKLWDLRSRSLLASLKGHSDWVRHVAFSPDGNTLATASGDKSAKLWDLRSRSLLASLGGHSGTVYHVAFSPDGNTLATASSDNSAKLWDLRSRSLLASLEGHSDWVLHLAFSPDGNTLATASGDKSARLWDLHSRSLLASLEGHSGSVTSLAFSPDGNTLATASNDNSAKLWDLRSRSLLVSLEGHSGPVNHLVFSWDGNTLATGSSDYSAKLWDLPSRSLLASLESHSDWVRRVAFSPDGNTLATASRDTSAKLWDLRSRSLLASLEGHSGSVTSLAFSPDGNTLATASSDKSAKLWDLRSRSLLASLEGHFGWVHHLAFSPDGNTLATASSDKSAKLWDVRSRSLLASLEGHSGWVLHLAFSPDGNTLATASYDKSAKLWNLRSRSLLASLEGHSDWVHHLAFSSDGNTLATASYDRSAKLWDLRSRSLLASLEGHSDWVLHLAFSPDGNTLATASNDSSAKLWDLRSRSLLASLEGHSGPVNHLAFSPDGNTLATASSDSSAKLWDLRSRSLLASLEGHSGSVFLLAFSPDGNTLATTSGDGTVRRWPVPKRSVAKEAIPHEILFAAGSEWLSVTPDQRYRGTELALEHLVYRDPSARDDQIWYANDLPQLRAASEPMAAIPASPKRRKPRRPM